MDKAQRIFVNTYTQKIDGSDVDCILDLGMQYHVQSIQLDTVAIDNLFMNFYNSQGKDFRIISFAGTFNGNPFNTTIVIDQYIKSLDSLCAYVNAQDYFLTRNARMTRIAEPDFLDTFAFDIRLSTNAAIKFLGTLTGAAWDKLGFNLPAANSFATPTFYGTRHADLSQPPVILVQIDQLPSGISNGYGTMSFMIPNNASYGSKILYQNHQKHSCQVIKWDTPVPLSQLHIRLLSCDQLPLQTPRQRGAQINQLDIEANFVFTINNTIDK